MTSFRGAVKVIGISISERRFDVKYGNYKAMDVCVSTLTVCFYFNILCGTQTRAVFITCIGTDRQETYTVNRKDEMRSATLI